MKHETMYKHLGEKFDKGNYTFCCDNGNVYFCNKDNTVLYMLPNMLVLSAAWNDNEQDHKLSDLWERYIKTGKHILAEDIETKRYQTSSGECDYCKYKSIVPGTDERIDREPKYFCSLYGKM